MNKNLKSLAWSIAIVLFYFYAACGVVKLFWHSKNKYIIEKRAKFILYILMLFSLIYIISLYHVFGVYHVDNFYKGLIGLHMLFILTGTIYNLLFTK